MNEQCIEENSLKLVQIVEATETPNDPDPTKKTRKRKRQSDKWKRNIRQKLRQSGKEYVNLKGNVTKPKLVQISNCGATSNCGFHCAENISESQRQHIHNEFWKLSNADKSHFYSKFINRTGVKRRRTNSQQIKKYTYQYFFHLNDEHHRVCKSFFLKTLDISQTRIFHHYSHVEDKETNIPRSPLQGKHVKHTIPALQKNKVIEHIKKFPVDDSHYWRSETEKEYLDCSLNIAKMHALYMSEVEQPVNYHMYAEIFNTSFNLSFKIPKKDRCDKCLCYEKNTNPSPPQIVMHEKHKMMVQMAQDERLRDMENTSKTTAVISFDMEKVFNVPMGFAAKFYYKRKLSAFNLMVRCKDSPKVLNVIWHEAICGRAGVHIANALLKALKKIVENQPKLTSLILWSDSCVPQNQNSIMTAALQFFMQSGLSGNVVKIEQKYSQAGHGCLQNIYSAHSVMERAFRHQEIGSPVALVKAIQKMPKRKLDFEVLQMQPQDYLDFSVTAANYRFSLVPYTEITCYQIEKDVPNTVKFSLEYDNTMTIVDLQPSNGAAFEQAPALVLEATITIDKLKDLKSMMPYLDQNDQNFYSAIIGDRLNPVSLPSMSSYQAKKKTEKSPIKINETAPVNKSIIVEKINPKKELAQPKKQIVQPKKKNVQPKQEPVQPN